MKHSCGALLYTFRPGDSKLGIILGKEGNKWFPFKGCKKEEETFEQAAIREIYEETAGLISISEINLDHNFSSKSKHYHIGLIEVPYEIISEFTARRCGALEKELREKQKIRFFTLEELQRNSCIHNLTKASIEYYWDKLISLEKNMKPVNDKYIENRCIRTEFYNRVMEHPRKITINTESLRLIREFLSS